MRCLLQSTSRPQAPMAWRTAGSGSHSPTLTAVGWSPSPTIRAYATHTHTHTQERERESRPAHHRRQQLSLTLTLSRTGSWQRARRAERSSRTSTCLTTGASSTNAKTNRCVREGRLMGGGNGVPRLTVGRSPTGGRLQPGAPLHQHQVGPCQALESPTIKLIIKYQLKIIK